MLVSQAKLGALSLALVAKCFAYSAPAPNLQARALLGTNFGVPNTDRAFDYVVVGGGTAGLAVAARLSEDPTKMVAVIEAGSFYELGNGNLSQIPINDVYWDGKDANDVNPRVDWGFITTPQVGENGNSSHYARGKTLGGCTARNYMAYQRGTKQSYAKWAAKVGDDSYEWDNFLPYFQKSVVFSHPDTTKRGANATPSYDLPTLGTTGSPLRLTFSNYALAFSTWAQKALATIGVQPINGFTSGSIIGSSYVIAAINHTTGTRESSQTAFLESAIGRPNFVVYVDTMAKSILWSGKQAIGVQVETEGYFYNLTVAKEVIVSAGTFQSPQFLMVSGVGPAAILEQFNISVVADRPGVGQNMWDHILFGPSYEVNLESTARLGDPVFANQAVNEFLTEQDGILASTGGDFLAFEKVPQPYRSNLSESALADLATFPDDWPEIEWLSVGGFFGLQQNYIRKAPTDGKNYATMAMALVAPLSRGNISITSADMNDHPLINPNWLSSTTDQQVAVAAYKRVRSFFATSTMKTVEMGPEAFPGAQVQSDAQILEIIKESFNTVYHASSTCAMGRANDTMAVVDSNGRVIGVNGLRVVDASAMPFLPPGHPMSTICE